MVKEKLNLTAAVGLMLALALALGAGCTSTKHSFSDRPAAVVINNHSGEDIQRAAMAVFKAHGFQWTRGEPGQLVLQKEGTFSNTMWHGDWFRGPVWVRVKMYQRELSPVQRVLDADIYMVQDHEDPLFQTERKTNSGKSEIQQLLDEVKAKVESES